MRNIEAKHKEVLVNYNKVRQDTHPTVVFSLMSTMKTPPTSQYEIEPKKSISDSTIERRTGFKEHEPNQNSTASSGFENDFKPDFPAFDNETAVATISPPQKQTSIEKTERRRKSESC